MTGHTYGHGTDRYAPEAWYPHGIGGEYSPSSGHGGSAPEQGRLVYVGLASIAKAVGAGPHTIKRWIREEAFPARRGTDGIYRATAASMQDWFTPPFPGLAQGRMANQWIAARQASSPPPHPPEHEHPDTL